jgi:AcrR family transcriptional regulator
MAEALLEAHEAGATIPELADLMGVNRMTIYRHFRSLGWRGTRGGHNKDWVTHSIVRSLRERGLSYREIGGRFGMSATWASQLMKTDQAQ